MTHATRVLLMIAGLTLGLLACSSRARVAHQPQPAPNPEPVQPAEPPPPANVPVEISVASATLGGDCPPPEVAQPTAGAPAPGSPAVMPPSAEVVADAPATGSLRSRSTHGRFAGGFCQGTNLQLRIEAPAHHPGGALEVVEVRLLSMEDEPLGTLEVRGLTLFADGAYTAWDSNVQPGVQNVSVHTSGPDWPTVGGDNNGYGQSFKIEVDVRVGGETRTVGLSPVSREPMIVT